MVRSVSLGGSGEVTDLKRVLIIMCLFLCENDVLLVMLYEHSGVNERFTLCTSETYILYLEFETIMFYLSIKRGLVNT